MQKLVKNWLTKYNQNNQIVGNPAYGKALSVAVAKNKITKYLCCTHIEILTLV